MDTTNNRIEVKIRFRDQEQNQEQEQEQEQDQEFRNYIIETNIALQERLITAIKETTDVQSTLHETENQLDQYVNRLDYMRNLLQNLEHLRHHYIKLEISHNAKTEIIEDSTQTLKLKYYNLIIDLCKINLLTAINPIILSLSQINIDQFSGLSYWSISIIQILYIIYIIYYGLQVYTKYNVIETIKKTSNQVTNRETNMIREIKNEIKKIENESLSLKQWLDEM